MNTEEKKKKLVTEEKHDFDSLRMLTEVLRGKDGCPWDIEQTHQSIRNDIIEETYEVVEAIDNDDKKLLREELGDVMFQVMFHSRIEEESGNFSVEDVINDVCEKMITRHPHVFGNVSVRGSEDVLNNWEQIKKAEKDRKTVKESMKSVPKQLPALMRARKIVKKAKKDAYDFNISEDNIVSLAEKLKNASTDEREKLLTEIIFDAVVLAGDADNEKNLNDVTDEFINNYKEQG